MYERYIWEGEVANLETYDNTDLMQTKAVFVPGIGCTINSVLDMHNVESTHGSTYDTAGLHRSKDPGSGAFTPYYGTHTVSTEPIEAGSEIFAAYGDTWIPDIPGAQVTFNANLEAAEEFLRDDYYRFVQSKKDQLKPNVLEGLWNFTRDFPVNQNHIFTVLPRNVEWKEIASVLDQKIQEQGVTGRLEDDDAVATTNGGEDDDGPQLYDPANMVTRHFIRQQSKKPLEWLQRYGRCCDHIKPGISTIPQAGRGAFANRDLPKGTIVGYSPLVHVGLEGEQLFTIPYGSKDPDHIPEFDEDGNQIVPDGYEMKDLVINYSFQHRDSTLTLTPYGSMVNYINHASSEGYEPNVKLAWPAEEMVAHKPDWLHKNITTLRHTLDKIGLSFDYVAIRDIKQGEELLMDYGPAWEAAWNKHVAEWKPLDDADDYMHSTEWPKDEPLRTEDELVDNPYPDNLETMCVESYYKDPRTDRLTWLPVLRQSNERIPCTVVARHEAPIAGKMPTYRVELFIGAEEEGGEDQILEVDQVPHKDIYLTDRVKSADWHMPNTFRHPIAIPDDLMPDVWKNIQPPASRRSSATGSTASSTSSAMPAGASSAANSGGKDEL